MSKIAGPKESDYPGIYEKTYKFVNIFLEELITREKVRLRKIGKTQ